MSRLSDPPAIIEFGHFSILPHRRQLLAEGRPVRLGGRAFDLLLALIEAPGAVVGKDELLRRIWPGRIVEEHRLQSEIWALRKAFGADRELIQTVPGRGYQFAGETHELGAGVGAQQVPEPLAVPAPVRPATNLSDSVSEVIDREAALSEVTDLVTHDAAERRQITAMSCEAIGVAARADGIGLENLLEAVGAFQHCVLEIAGRHGGFIANRLGNTVLVLFGYPAAHEHDAEQAIRAGLELCAAVRTLRPDADAPMRCRVGIATGMVIVGDLVGVGEVRDHGIVGDAPDLAGRLQVSAQPDTVTIEPPTWRLIGNLFDCRDLGALDTNSDTAPIRRWQVLGESVVASRFEALRGSELTPLVGRDEEIDLLLRRWARAKAGDGQIILVSGEAGLGKSRIAAAFEECLHAEPHLCLRYFCSLSPGQRAVPSC
jgi:DNA-binding winged helix-turn-helix (wHTH) protein